MTTVTSQHIRSTYDAIKGTASSRKSVENGENRQ